MMQIITWHLETFTCEAAAFMKHRKNNSKRLWPWKKEHDLSVHSCLSPQLPLCLLDLFPSVKIKWHNNGEKDLSVWGKEKLISKVAEVNKGFYLECIPYRKKMFWINVAEQFVPHLQRFLLLARWEERRQYFPIMSTVTDANVKGIVTACQPNWFCMCLLVCEMS